MHVDIEELVRHQQVIRTCESVVDLRQAVVASLRLFGIRSAYFLAPLTRDVRAGRVVTVYNLPWVWEKQYRAGLYTVDPLPLIAMDRLEAFYWPDVLEEVEIDRRQARYIAIARQYGLGRGIGVACFGPDGRSGFLGAVLPPEVPAPSTLTLMRMHSLGQISFHAYCRLIRREAGGVPSLSNRELEVLHWIGRGKSNSVIAEILGISASSVDVYVRRIFGKLDVTDRTTASVKAMSMGLIVSDDYDRFIRESQDWPNQG